MGNYKQLKQAVADVIKTNGNQEITGAILQNSLLTIISTVGANATFAGIATPETNPGTPDQNVFYIASKNGIYTNFNGASLYGEVLLFINNNGSWQDIKTGIATTGKSNEIINRYKNYILPISSLIKSLSPQIIQIGESIEPINTIGGYIGRNGKIYKDSIYGQILVFNASDFIKCDFTKIGIQAVLALSEVSDGSLDVNVIIDSKSRNNVYSEFIYAPNLYVYIYAGPRTANVSVKKVTILENILNRDGGVVTNNFANFTYAKIVRGGNLFDKNDPGFVDNSLINKKGEIYTASYSNGFSVTPKILVKPNTQYTSNYKPGDPAISLCVFDEYDNVIYYMQGNTSSTPEDERFVFQVLTGNDARYIRFAFNNSYKENIIFQEGSEAIDPISVEEFTTEPQVVNNYWNKKNIALYGDSITSLCGNDSVINDSWAYYIEKKLYAKCIVRGWGGAPLRHSTWNNSSVGQTRWWFNINGEKVPVGTIGGIKINVGGMCDWKRIITQFPQTIKDTIDAVILMGGTNDFLNAIKGDTIFEEYSEIPSDISNYDVDWCNSEYYNGGDFKIKTTQGAICSAIMKLQAWMPQATIIVATQLSGRNTSGGGINGVNQPTNSEGLNEMQFADTIIEAARYMSVPIIDIYGLTGINQQNRKYYIADSAHPYKITDGGGIRHNNGNVAIARVFIGELIRILPKFDYLQWENS